MKSILVLTYYWPPASGGGVQRILKFCKYLREFGYEPTVIAGPSDAAKASDVSLEQDARGIKTIRINNFFDPSRLFSKKAQNPCRSDDGRIRRSVISELKRVILNFLWLNIFIPDAKIAWYIPVRNRLTKILKATKFDVCISTGPPYTTHLLGRFVYRKWKIPWIADFRDAWEQNPAYNIAFRLPHAIGLNRYLEKRVLKDATRVITVGPSLANLLKRNQHSARVEIVYNGYDESDFADLQYAESRSFRLGYYGEFMNHRTPVRFLQSLSSRLAEDSPFSRDFRLYICGPVGELALATLRELIPTENLVIQGNIAHAELIKQYGCEQVLLFLIENSKHNEIMITGKLFEYLRTGWPILGFGPVSGDAATIISEANSGRMFEFSDDQGHVDWLLSIHKQWSSGMLRPRKSLPKKYDRRALTRDLAGILHSVGEKMLS